VSLDCCYEHAGLCPGRGPSGPAPSGDGRLTGRGGTAMEVMFDRVAGLDVGKETVTVCLRTPARGVGGAVRRARLRR